MTRRSTCWFILSLCVTQHLFTETVTSSTQLTEDDDLDFPDSLLLNAMSDTERDDDVKPAWFKLVLGKRAGVNATPHDDVISGELLRPMCQRLCSVCWGAVSTGKELMCRLDCVKQTRGPQIEACFALFQRLVLAHE